MLVRSAFTLAAWLCYYNAARSLQLAELTTIYYAAPFIVTVLSVLILGETVPLLRWLAVFIGFVGVFIACDPTRLGLSLPVLLVLAAAVLWGIAVVLLSQLNREVERRADKEPVLADLRDSGAIEQDLDVAVLLWTAREFDDGVTRIVGWKVAKNRGGPKGKFAMEFEPAVYRWAGSTASLDATPPGGGRALGRSFE